MDLKAVESALSALVMASRAWSGPDEPSSPGMVDKHQWTSADVTVDGQGVRVERSVTVSGRGQFRYWVGERRVNRAALLHLTCPVQACPQRRETLERWRGQMAQASPSRPGPETPEATATVPPAAPAPSWTARRSWRLSHMKRDTPEAQIVHELPVIHEGRAALARSACQHRPLRCPQDAHEVIYIAVPIWDLFTPEGRFIATVDRLLKEVAPVPSRNTAQTPG